MPIALPVSSPVANGKGSTSLIFEIGIFGIERRIYRKGAYDVRSPNITGYAQAGWIYPSYTESGSGGSLSMTLDPSSTNGVGHSNGPDRLYRVSLNASDSSSSYGMSQTVQPRSLQLLPCIKS